MKLWVLSDMHVETRPAWQPQRPEDFDVLVVAGDVSVNLLTSIEAVALLADGKPAVFVAGNHEWASRDADERKEAATAAGRYGVTWLEMSAVDLNGVVVAGATLWEPGDGLHDLSVAALAAFDADVIVTHYPPVPSFSFRVLPVGGLWISGHHHGFADATISDRRFVRNALGYWGEEEIAVPAREDFVIEVRS
jgi:predicted phosphodiesterase